MTLDLPRIMASIQRSGFAYVCRSIPRTEVEEFAEANGLMLEQDQAMFTWTLREKNYRPTVTIESLRAQLGRKRK